MINPCVSEVVSWKVHVWRILGVSLDIHGASAESPTPMTAGCPTEDLSGAKLVGEA